MAADISFRALRDGQTRITGDKRKVKQPMNDEETRRWTHMMFKALRGYPFLPCPICVRQGFKGMACDHTVLERAEATHPGLSMSGPVRREGAKDPNLYGS